MCTASYVRSAKRKATYFEKNLFANKININLITRIILRSTIWPESNIPFIHNFWELFSDNLLLYVTLFLLCSQSYMGHNVSSQSFSRLKMLEKSLQKFI